MIILSLSEKKIILDFGYKKKDFEIIEKSLNYTTYNILFNEWNFESISRNKAIELLGIEIFLSALCRSTFYYSAVISAKNGQKIMFSSKKIDN